MQLTAIVPETCSRPLCLEEAICETAAFPHVHIVREAVQLERIGRIRHKQYVQTHGKAYRTISSDPSVLIEAADTTSVNIFSQDATGMTAALRVGSLADSNYPQLPVFLEAALEANIDLSKTISCTRLVKSPEHRGNHPLDLMRFVWMQTVAAGYRFCIIQASERMIPYFERVGCKKTNSVSDDHAAGRLWTMILDTGFAPTQQQRGTAGVRKV